MLSAYSELCSVSYDSMRVEFSKGFVVALQGSLRRTKRQSWFSMPKQDIHKDISVTKCPERFLPRFPCNRTHLEHGKLL
jgi:hypothetical protein